MLIQSVPKLKFAKLQSIDGNKIEISILIEKLESHVFRNWDVNDCFEDYFSISSIVIAIASSNSLSNFLSLATSSYLRVAL